MNEKILMYSVPAQIHRQIAEIALKLGVECKKIPKGRFNQLLGCHVGSLEADSRLERYEGEDFPVPMMIFAGVSNKSMDMILEELSKKGLAQDYYKAIVTPANNMWTALNVYEELRKERKEISKMDFN